MNAIDKFTIQQFERMGAEASLDSAQIEKLRESGIPKREAWAVAMCDQLASGFMFIAGQWRKPTANDVFAAKSRANATEQQLARDRNFEARIMLRHQIAEASRAEATDAERAAVEQLLREGRANVVAIVSEPERLSLQADKLRDTSAREGLLARGVMGGLETDVEFYVQEGKAIDFVASEKTKIIFEEETGIDSIFIEAGDQFISTESGDWSVIQSKEAAKTIIANNDEVIRRLLEGGVIVDAQYEAGGQAVAVTFESGAKFNCTREAWGDARQQIRDVADFLPLTSAGIDGAIQENGPIVNARQIGNVAVALSFRNGQTVTVPLPSWQQRTNENPPALGGMSDLGSSPVRQFTAADAGEAMDAMSTPVVESPGTSPEASAAAPASVQASDASETPQTNAGDVGGMVLSHDEREKLKSGDWSTGDPA